MPPRGAFVRVADRWAPQQTGAVLRCVEVIARRRSGMHDASRNHVHGAQTPTRHSGACDPVGGIHVALPHREKIQRKRATLRVGQRVWTAMAPSHADAKRFFHADDDSGRYTTPASPTIRTEDPQRHSMSRATRRMPSALQRAPVVSALTRRSLSFGAYACAIGHVVRVVAPSTITAT